MVAQLLEVVDHPDHAEDQGEEEDIQVFVIPRLDLFPPGHQAGGSNGDDEHDAAHGGGALLGHVPGGAVRPDGLAGFQPVQQRNQQLARDGGHAEGDNKAEDVCHGWNPPGFSLLKGPLPEGAV